MDQGAHAEPSCVPCAAGTFHNQTGQPSCLRCAPGQFQDRPGQTACNVSQCPPGTHQADPGTGSRYATLSLHANGGLTLRGEGGLTVEPRGPLPRPVLGMDVEGGVRLEAVGGHDS